MNAKPDRAGFHRVLAQEFAVPEQADAIMEILEPFFRQGDGEVFSLAALEDVSRVKIFDAVNRLQLGAVGYPCSKIEYVSVTSSSCADVKEGVSPSLAPCFARMFGEHLTHALGVERRTELENRLWNCLCEPLWPSFERGGWVKVDWPLRLEIRAVILEALTYFVGFRVAGEDDVAEMLRPMVELLSAVGILGLKRNMPDMVVVLVR